MPGGLQADVQISLPEISIDNINTMTQPMELLETVPEEPYWLNNTMTMGLPPSADGADDGRPLSVVANGLRFSIVTEGKCGPA